MSEHELLLQADSDISEYTYERTMKMEERYKIVQELHMRRKETMADPQIAFMDQVSAYPSIPSSIYMNMLQVNKRKSSQANIAGSNLASPDANETTKLTDIPEHESTVSSGQVPQVRTDRQTDIWIDR